MVQVLINAANLRHGGGVQVAASFLDELADLVEDDAFVESRRWLRDGLTVQASTAVLANTRAGTRATLGVLERNTKLDVAALTRRFDATFTIFGPEYVPYRSGHRIVGFADGTSLFPELIPAELYPASPRKKLRRWLSRQLFSRVDSVVTETPLLAESLHSRWGLGPANVHVVPNTVHSVFSRPDEWQPALLSPVDDRPHVLYVTRGYPHKNVDVLGRVGALMADRGTPVRFVLTLDDVEWSHLSEVTRSHSVNLGPVTLPRLPLLYRSCAAAIFPSLLESFSVTPLEALHAGIPLVASDRHFVRQCAGDVPFYADPEDPSALAEALHTALTTDVAERVAAGMREARAWPDASSRARAYVALVERGVQASEVAGS